MPNKNYVIGVGAVIVVIAIIAVVLMNTGTVYTMSLDQILKNKDCAVLEKWESEHIYDHDLDIGSLQSREIMELEIECGVKAIENIADVLDVSSSNEKVTRQAQIALDKYQYKIGEQIHVNITIIPDWHGGIVIDIDRDKSVAGKRTNLYDVDKDSKYNTTIQVKDWGIGIHAVNVRDSLSSTGYYDTQVEFEIIE